MILETKRLILREMTKGDFGALTDMLYDEEVMYAYEHAFTEEEAEAWLNNQLNGMKRTVSDFGRSYSKKRAK